MTRVWQSCLVVALLVFVTVAIGARGAAQDNEFAALSEFIDPSATLTSASGFGYVCYSVLVPNGVIPTMGTYGYIYLQLRTAANCGGTNVGTARLFSDGATHSQSLATHLYSEAALVGYAQMLQRAADTGQRVQWIRCSSTKTGCLKYIYMRAD